MITVVIETFNDEHGLARTLASLVPAAVEGLVREVIICDSGSTDGTEQVADHAGCLFLKDTGCPKAVLDHARGEWLLLLRPGARLVTGWMEPAREHLSASNRPATFSRSRQTALPLFHRLFRRRAGMDEGLLIPRTSATAPIGRPMRLTAEIHAV